MPLVVLKVGMVSQYLIYFMPEWVMWVSARSARVGEWVIEEKVWKYCQREWREHKCAIILKGAGTKEPAWPLLPKTNQVVQ